MKGYLKRNGSSVDAQDDQYTVESPEKGRREMLAVWANVSHVSTGKQTVKTTVKIIQDGKVVDEETWSDEIDGTFAQFDCRIVLEGA